MDKTLETQRREIRRAAAALGLGAGRRYPATLRSKISAYSRERMAAGVRLRAVAAEIGVSHPTLVRFVGASAAAIRRVRVSEAPATTDQVPQQVVVRGPCGVVVEGLDIAGAAALLRALS